MYLGQDRKALSSHPLGIWSIGVFLELLPVLLGKGLGSPHGAAPGLHSVLRSVTAPRLGFCLFVFSSVKE